MSNTEKLITTIQKRLLDKLSLSNRDKKMLFGMHGEVLLSSSSEQIEKLGTRYLNHKYAPLAPSTKRAYKKRGYDLNPTLDRTGRLKSSISIKADSKGVTIGSNVEYAKYLQFGTRNMSPRPFLPMPPFQKKLLKEDLDDIRAVTVDFYKDYIKKLKL